MSVKVRTTQETTREKEFTLWDAACGDAVREALAGATTVVLIDTDGTQYTIYAGPRDDNS